MHDYKRKPWRSIGFLVLGLLIMIDVLRTSDFYLLYEGIKLAVSLAQIGLGLWGLLTPLVSIRDTQLNIYESAFSTIKIDLKSTSVVLEADQLLLTGPGAPYHFPLSQLRETDRQEFLYHIRRWSLTPA
jgi:hypothetical protein